MAKTSREYGLMLHDAVHEMAEWGRIGKKSRRYMHSKQWDDMETSGQTLTHNVIRRDIENLVARLIEADPVIDTQGRGPEDWQISAVWKDLLRWSEEWTGAEYDSVLEVRRRCLMHMYTVGLGIEEVGYASDEEGGQGMVVSKALDPMHFAWADDAESVQLRDATWMAKYPPVLIEKLEKEFPDLKDEIRADVPGFFTQGFQQARFSDYRNLMQPNSDSQSVPGDRYKKAYRQEFWEKDWKWSKRLLLPNGDVWTVSDPNPEDPEAEKIKRPGTPEDAGRMLTEQEQNILTEEKVKEYELTTTVVINDHMAQVKKRSIYDDREGGHGEYPFAFYMGSQDPDQSHPHGEVEYLMGYQDFINQMMSRYSEQMFIQSSQFLWVNKGMMPKGEEGKLDNMGRKPLQKIFGYPGQAPPQFVGANAGASQMWQQGIEFMTSLKDKMSTVADVNRAAPQYELSGKAVRALQADADLFSTIPRKNVESAMRQATMLRISVMMQFFRGKRFARITPKAGTTKQEPYTIFMGNDEQMIQDTHALRKSDDGKAMETPGGDRGIMLPLNDQEIRKFDLRLSLDSGKEAKKAERAELVTNMMQYMGPAAGMGILKWAAQLLEVPNFEELAAALDEADVQGQAMAQIDQLQKETGMSLPEMIQAIKEMAAAKPPGGPPGGGPPGAGPPGAGPPPGGPPGGGGPPPPGGGGPPGGGARMRPAQQPDGRATAEERGAG